MSLCILFDLDGTLVDSEALGRQALLEFVPSRAMQDVARLVKAWGYGERLPAGL